MSRSGYGNNRTYTYTLPDGTQIASSRGDDAAPTISSTDDGYLYLASIEDTTHRPCIYLLLRRANGTLQDIGTSTGADTDLTAATLYSRFTSGTQNHPSGSPEKCRRHLCKFRGGEGQGR